MTDLTRAVVAFGANLGDRAATIQAAADALAATEGVDLVALAPVVETQALRPDGIDPEAPAYLNTVAVVLTTLSPAELHAGLRRLEDAHGRVRTERWGDRTLDLDLIVYGDLEQ
ncbi:MAG: 2-amino-4-hydroxy-6-hydroxymethyldihydropteridine diphosphokinase, partial [Protaetiibacter sp.]